jgi:hypothetical protein
MRNLFSHALVILAIAALLAITTPHGIQAANAPTSSRAGTSQHYDPIDVPWGG